MRPHVVIAGGGIAGVEALLALRELAGQGLSIELIAPEPDLVMRPLAVTAPFGTGEVKRFGLDAICADQQVHLRTDSLDFVDVAGHRAETLGGARVAYDSLVLAVGARRRDALRGALVFDGEAGIRGLRRILDELRDGSVHSLAFVVPEGITWALPLYELALMTALELEGTRTTLTFVTPERDALELFGRPARDRVRALLVDRGIDVRIGARPLQVTDRFLLTSAGAIPADRVVALPAIEGPRVAGVPCDAHGFLETDDHGAISEAPDVYAAGDGTAHPVKQGGLAAQQADVIAEAIASAAGAPCEPQPFRPRLRAQLFTGTLPWFFRGGAEEPGRAVASPSALWSPPGKVAARYLAPYLADRLGDKLGVNEPLEEREPVPAEQRDAAEKEAARDLALMFADDEAEAGDTGHALHWLEAAEDVAGVLPAEYVDKRRRWREGQASGRPPVREVGGAWR